jgi:hypothetical protein
VVSINQTRGEQQNHYDVQLVHAPTSGDADVVGISEYTMFLPLCQQWLVLRLTTRAGGIEDLSAERLWGMVGWRVASREEDAVCNLPKEGSFEMLFFRVSE